MPNLRFELRGLFRIKNIIISILIAALLSGGLFIFTWINSTVGANIMPSIAQMQSDISNAVTYFLSDANKSEDIDWEEIKSKLTEYNNEFNFQVLKLHGKAKTAKMEFPHLVLDVFKNYNKIKKYLPKDLGLESDQFVKEGTVYFTYLVEGGFAYEDPEHSLVGTNFSKKVVLIFFGLPLALLLCILLKDLFAWEYENNVVRFRFTQPGSMYSYFISKIVSAVLFSILFMVILVLISYLIGGLFGGEFGRWDYPSLKTSLLDGGVFGTNMQYEGIPIWSYILKSSVSIIAVLALLFSMMIFMSVLIKSPNIVSLIFFILLPPVVSATSTWFGNGKRFIFRSGTAYYKVVYKFIYNPFTLLIPDKIINDLKNYPIHSLAISVVIACVFIFISVEISKITFVQHFSLVRRPMNNLAAIGRHERTKVINKFVTLRFGLLRLFKQETFYVFLTLIILGSGIFGLYSSGKHKSAINNRIDLIKFIADGKSSIIHYSPVSEAERKGKEESIIKEATMYLKAFQNNDTEVMAKYFIRDIRINQNSHGGRSEESAIFNIRLYNEMGRRGSEFEIYDSTRGSIQPTIFSKYKNILDFIKKNFLYPRYQPSITFNINKLFRQYIYIILLAVLAYIGATVFGVFPVYKNKAKDGLLIRLQPIKRNRIYLAGMGTALSALLIIFSASILAPSSAILARGEGFEKNYPAVKFINDVNVDFDGHTEMVSKIAANRGDEEAEKSAADRIFGYRYRDMGNENFEMIALAFIAAVLAISLMSVLGAAAGILVMLAGYIISAFALKAASVYLPFVWANWYSVASGTSNVIYNSHSFNFVVGAGVMLAWSLLIVGVKYIFKMKRSV